MRVSLSREMNCWRWFGLLALTAVTLTARAQGRSVAAGVCDAPRTAALGQLSCELIRDFPGIDGELLVVAVNPADAKDGAAGDELALNLSRQLAADLAPKARAHRKVVTKAAAAALAKRGLDVAIVESNLSRERLTATLSVVQAQKFWRRFSSEASVLWRSQATRASDSELRQYLPVVPLVVSKIDRAAPLDEPILALGCGDVDGDGSLEIVAVGRRRIQMGRVVRGRFSVLASASWSELSEIAPRPLREPIATASVLPGGGVAVGLSDRADGLRLDDKLQVVERYPGRLPWPGAGCAKVEAGGLGDRVLPCAARDAKLTAAARAVDTLAGLSLARRDGTTHTLLATRGADGMVELALGARRVKLDAAAGAQLALAELNGDGLAELLTTESSLDPGQDALIARTLDDAGAAKGGFRVAVPSGVRALTVCPSEGPLLTPIVMATGDGLWVVR